MSLKDTITIKLTEAFQPTRLEVIDESHLHAGHSGHRDGGESHFRVKMTSSHFNQMMRIQQHRAVNATLEEELKGGIHALALELKSETHQI